MVNPLLLKVLNNISYSLKIYKIYICIKNEKEINVVFKVVIKATYLNSYIYKVRYCLLLTIPSLFSISLFLYFFKCLFLVLNHYTSYVNTWCMSVMLFAYCSTRGYIFILCLNTRMMYCMHLHS